MHHYQHLLCSMRWLHYMSTINKSTSWLLIMGLWILLATSGLYMPWCCTLGHTMLPETLLSSSMVVPWPMHILAR